MLLPDFFIRHFFTHPLPEQDIHEVKGHGQAKKHQHTQHAKPSPKQHLQPSEWSATEQFQAKNHSNLLIQANLEASTQGRAKIRRKVASTAAEVSLFPTEGEISTQKARFRQKWKGWCYHSLSSSNQHDPNAKILTASISLSAFHCS